MDRADEKLANGISSLSNRERAEREIDRLGDGWVCLSELAKRARVRSFQMCRFLTEHLAGAEFAVEPFVERRSGIIIIRSLGVRLSFTEYRRKQSVE